MTRKALVTASMVVALASLFIGCVSLWKTLSMTVWDEPSSHLGIRCKSCTVEIGYSNTVVSSSIPTTSGPTIMFKAGSQAQSRTAKQPVEIPTNRIALPRPTVPWLWSYRSLLANGTLEWTSPTGFQVGGGSSSYRLRFLKLSIWVPVAVFAGYPLFTFIRGPFRRWRRERKGWCLSCGYDLEGNVSGRCPECGKAISNAT